MPQNENKQRCAAVTAVGVRCRAWAMRGRDVCNVRAGLTLPDEAERVAGRACSAVGKDGKKGVKAYVLFFGKRPGPSEPWTQKLWIYDLRTNKHFTLVRDPLTRTDLDDFVACYNLDNRYEREETWSEDNPDSRWRSFNYEELQERDKLNLDFFWIRDESLEGMANLPDPEVIAADMVADLEAALEQLRLIAEDLNGEQQAQA